MNKKTKKAGCKQKQHVRIVKTKRGRKRVIVNKGYKPKRVAKSKLSSKSKLSKKPRLPHGVSKRIKSLFKDSKMKRSRGGKSYYQISGLLKHHHGKKKTGLGKDLPKLRPIHEVEREVYTKKVPVFKKERELSDEEKKALARKEFEEKMKDVVIRIPVQKEEDADKKKKKKKRSDEVKIFDYDELFPEAKSRSELRNRRKMRRR